MDHLRAVYRSVVAEVRFYYWFYSYQRLLDKRWLSFASWWSESLDIMCNIHA